MSAFFTLFAKLRSSEFLELAPEKQACLTELKKWEILLDIEPLLADAEVKKRENPGLKAWLDELQQLAYDMDDILDVFATKSLERKVIQKNQASASKVQKFVSTSFIRPAAFKYFSSQLMSKMKEITHRLQDLEKQRSEFSLISEISGSARRSGQIRPRSTPFVGDVKLYGGKEDEAKIKKFLLNNTVQDDGVAVICIVGMGGIGKTTLAKFAWDDDEVTGYFDLKVWLTVCDDFDVTRLTKSILEATSSKEYGATDLRMLQVQLKETLNNKRFLLVLDDVWNENYADWQIFRSPFAVGAPGSKILVTTRSRGVSEIMGTVPALEWDLPEVRNSIGTVFQSSYDVLPYRLKQCFAYCSIFPKDYEFGEEEVVLLWMAEGFLSEATNKVEMENLGAECFEELVAKSLFQRSNTDKSRFVMHKFIHDLAQSVAETTCFRMEDDGQLQKSECIRGRMQKPERIRHLAYDSAWIDEFKKIKSSMNLRTFMPIIRPPAHDTNRCITKDILLELLPKLKFSRVLSLGEFSMSHLPDCFRDLIHLRYLDFSHSKIKSLPDSVCALLNLQTLLLKQCRNLEKLPQTIGNLVNLRYLDFSHSKIKSLPDSVSALLNLRTLLLSQCRNLEKLPSTIGSLINLCHLDITETISLKGMPIKISELTNLQTLSRFVLAPGEGLHIRAMKNLLKLKGELSISGLENILTPEDASEAGLGGKSGLKRLKLMWSKNSDRNLNGENERKVLVALKPPEMLEELTVDGYGGTSLPSIGELPSLRKLCIRGCNNMSSVGAEFYGGNLSNAFSSLETLCFEDMLKWKEWNPCEVDELTGNFPLLRQLSIISCPKLSGRLPSCLPSLEKLVIRRCKELEVSVSTSPVLRELEIDGCKNLVHRSAVTSGSLKEVSVSNILDLTCLTERLMLWFRNIKSLEIDGCKELISLWPNRKQLLAHAGPLVDLKIPNRPNLVLLEAEEGEEELQVEIPRSIDYLNLSLMSYKLPKASRIFTSLKKLRIERCPNLVSFSEVCFPLTLTRLVISNCEKLQYFLQDKGKDININNNSFLEDLEIEQCPSLVSLSSSCLLSVWLQNKQIDSGSKLASLSSSAKMLGGIKKLRISSCPKLESISGELLVGLQLLRVLNCSKLTALSQSSKLPKELKSLRIMNCPELTSIANEIHDNTSLAYISVIGCQKIKSLPQGLDKLKNLQHIELVYCPVLSSSTDSLSSSDSWLPTTNLKVLQIDACEKLQNLPNNFHNLTSLEKLELEISNCSIPKEGLPVSLKSLSISEKTEETLTLKKWGLHKLTSLEMLTIEGGCLKVVSFPPEEIGMELPPSLVQLTIKNFPKLQFLSSEHFKKLSSLKYLSIMDCPKVMSLPKTGSLPLLYRLHIDDCPLLGSRCLTSRLERQKIAHVRYVRIDDQVTQQRS